ncbi:MAG: helix-turn-helix domain-containing protein [Roseburia faecis]
MPVRTHRLSGRKIAQAVGFSSQPYFSQAFRRETTLSPDAYRRQFLS